MDWGLGTSPGSSINKLSQLGIDPVGSKGCNCAVSTVRCDARKRPVSRVKRMLTSRARNDVIDPKRSSALTRCAFAKFQQVPFSAFIRSTILDVAIACLPFAISSLGSVKPYLVQFRGYRIWSSYCVTRAQIDRRRVNFDSRGRPASQHQQTLRLVPSHTGEVDSTGRARTRNTQRHQMQTIGAFK
jgi:hypothetical protein